MVLQLQLKISKVDFQPWTKALCTLSENVRAELKKAVKETRVPNKAIASICQLRDAPCFLDNFIPWFKPICLHEANESVWLTQVLLMELLKR